VSVSTDKTRAAITKFAAERANQPHNKLFFAISDRLGKGDPLVAQLLEYIEQAEMVKGQYEEVKEAYYLRRDRAEKEERRLKEKIAELQLKYEYGDDSEEE